MSISGSSFGDYAGQRSGGMRLGHSTLVDSTTQRLLGVGFVIFLFSISRIGISELPNTTNIFWLLAYLVLALSFIGRPLLYIHMSKKNALFLMSAAFAMLTALWSLTPTLSASRGLLLILNILVGFMVFHQLGLRRTIVLVFWFCFLVQAASLILLLMKHPIAYDYVRHMSKGLYLHKNTMAQHSVLLYFTSIVLMGSGWRFMLSLSGAVLAVACLVMSASGTGLILVVFMTALLIACRVMSLGERPSSFIAGSAIVFISFTAAALFLAQFDLFTSVLGALDKDTTLTGRTLLWDQALKSFEAHPWFGIGYFSFWNSTQTAATSILIATGQRLESFHNIYLDIVVGVGAIGLAMFSFGLLLILWRSWRLMVTQRSALWTWPFAYVCFVIANGVSEYPFFWNNEFHMLLAVVAAATCVPPPRDPPLRLRLRR